MTSLLSLIVSLFLFIQSPNKEIANTDSIDTVISAIENSSSGDLAKYFDSSISLNVNGLQGDYSKNQAELVLKDFFKKNPSMGFILVFRSENNPSLSSFIGDYQSAQGLFKVFIKVSQQDADFKIYSLEFVKG
ncbi:uncharacterized protein DUF4783 [Algoriphagus ratkowskyi]|uniref:DUF4783 domain-containing protein n=1 Tax=Algoriphagus ratkowskyi TaxID=57028 RepID=A0A2W7RG65_9BACT|nr:DUF4783 domain-containing protein [Algoriphagus ratkowskyi]PZX59928.1 uncharacterized protein DUF4783 [Algoriphagus ratkowskyi]TXD78370.1 DUF4783 domain-containing protein [Algoriphagus ratkowskyi]